MFKPVTQPIAISSVVNACVFWLTHKDHTRTDIDIVSDIHGFYLVLCLRYSLAMHTLLPGPDDIAVRFKIMVNRFRSTITLLLQQEQTALRKLVMQYRGIQEVKPVCA